MRDEIRNEPFAVERNGVAIDIGYKLRRSERVYEWLSLDRWNVVVADTLTETSRAVHQTTDADGVHWMFRPVMQSDHSLLFPLAEPVPPDFPAWVRERLTPG